MKNLKITLLALIVLISMPAIGMEQAPHSKAMDVDAQSYLMNLPGDLQREIIKIIATSSSYREAIDAIRALTRVNKRYYNLINDKDITDSLIALLADKWYQGYRIRVAWDLQTAGSKNWFSTQKAREWFKNFKDENGVINQNFSFYLLDNKPLSRTRVMLLLKLGFNPNTEHGMQELFKALENNDLELFKAMLQAGADPNTRDSNPFGERKSILRQAIDRKKLEFIDALLSAGADSDAPSNYQQESAMQYVAGMISIMKSLDSNNTYWSTVLKKLQERR